MCLAFFLDVPHLFLDGVASVAVPLSLLNKLEVLKTPYLFRYGAVVAI